MSNVKDESHLSVWASDVERQMHLNYAFDALMDLAQALDIDTKYLSLDNKLAIAFGSRGSGNALAHYEPSKVVINLTKIKGAGSLAHEWFHAFDDYLGSLNNNTLLSPFASQNKSLRNLSAIYPKTAGAFMELIDTIKHKKGTRKGNPKEKNDMMNRLEVTISKSLSILEESFLSEEKLGRKVGRKATDEELEQFSKIKNSIFSGENATITDSERIVEELSTLRKKVKGKVIPKEHRQRLSAIINFYSKYVKDNIENKEVICTVKTDYYKAALKLDSYRTKPYWSTIMEIMARAFESYVQDKIEIDHKSEYLVHGTKTNYLGSMKLPSAYPTGKERCVFYNAFEKFFKTLKEELNLNKFSYVPISKKVVKPTKVNLEMECQNFEFKSKTVELSKDSTINQLSFI